MGRCPWGFWKCLVSSCSGEGGLSELRVRSSGNRAFSPAGVGRGEEAPIPWREDTRGAAGSGRARGQSLCAEGPRAVTAVSCLFP